MKKKIQLWPCYFHNYQWFTGTKDTKNYAPSDCDQSNEYENLNLRAKRLSEKLKRLSTEEMEKEIVTEPNDQQSKEVKEILRRYSGLLGKKIELYNYMT